jgi:hypothetical protein
MLELTVLGSVLRGISVLYWVLAFGALALVLWRVKGRVWKSVSALAVVAIFGFFPTKEVYEAHQRQAYAREAWTYFRKLCTEKSGEKVYKTYTGVKSVLVVKPLPPATETDLFDQFWYGDPYSNATPWNKRGLSTAGTLTLDSRGPNGIKRGFEFVEVRQELNGVPRYQRITRPPSYDKATSIEDVERPVSRFGISWEDISTPADRVYWVAGSRLQVVDLTDNSVIAVRIGYFIEAGFGSKAGGRRPWLTSRGPNTTCPSLAGGDYTDQWFILSALKPDGEKWHGE